MISLDPYHTLKIKKTDNTTIHLDAIGQKWFDKNVLQWLLFHFKILVAITILSIYKDSNSIYLILLALLTYIVFSAYRLLRKSRQSNNQLKKIVVNTDGIQIDQSHEPAKIYKREDINTLLVEYSDDKHIKLIINEKNKEPLFLFIANIFIRPTFDEDIINLLGLDILGEREHYGEKTTILTRSAQASAPKLFHCTNTSNSIVFILPLHRITLDHQNRNITTKATLGPKRYISFDSIAEYNVTDLKLSIIDTEGFEFILFEMDAKSVSNDNYIYYQQDLETIMNTIDLDIKSKVIESLETLKLKPLPKVKKIATDSNDQLGSQ